LVDVEELELPTTLDADMVELVPRMLEEAEFVLVLVNVLPDSENVD
jgi:hypothetical protein